MVQTLSRNAVIVEVTFSAVQLAFGLLIALLQSMIANIQCGLCTLVKAFCEVMPTSNPWIVMAYTYLTLWYMMHCPSLMSTILLYQEFTPYVQRLVVCQRQFIHVFHPDDTTQ